MALNLDGPQRIFEGFMTTEVTVVRDTERFTNDTFDRETGTYTNIVGEDPQTIVEGLNCTIVKAQSSPKSRYGGVTTSDDEYLISCPLDSDPLQACDAVEITACRDEDQIGIVLYIWKEMEISTFAVSKKYTAKLYAPEPFLEGAS